MNGDEYTNMKTIGTLYNRTSHQVGRELRDCGYRDHGGKATQKALGSGMARLHRDADHPEWVAVLWHRAKVSELLEAFGWERTEHDGTEE